MKIPKSIFRLIESFEKLPGIGPKTAQRLTFYLLHVPQEEMERFAAALVDLKKNTKLCSICKNVDETDICGVCSDPVRDKNTIAVVAGPMDVFALEKTGYKGVYHVLHGLIDPLNNIGPEEIFINELVKRLKNDIDGEVEVIMATSTSMEGESTAMFIAKLIRESNIIGKNIKITRLARGLPVGGDVEYADDITLGRALEGRSVI
ncbi:recombination protein RecR [candidate division WWE3 bacterium RIFCSPHIGHO2_12_FULL_38_15]|uniref:Recombination protein RecR n=1 Tax=candidate division WWE3 bacterium RIFCSPHIGHO2_02_FULL_38_14 TaxID=1802620 RepID=A0A1F4V781_UNCKA|nr:MAG: recombination protein RecR [candidate division WWE3 bacterium RIFCSPHIGHO2_01_FULL_38_45]OGC48877.1 MAG: recombination protein RecR [candidate division WWE3 bacterium RIFCSPHIGHO2_12_FULL_38_15]OGC53024.1 MAG: recombination protein RecR [candidate division WWE3 bacterium RIFCSPHIGHO2_02_FULL_38_14]OGC53180.1 MAG: recombination protein RecR [candidate division WWE3 bacterium RIFCSPLOWO2_01_FULL_37_24]HLB52025.1 recombination mediator RecR [Patescibacteria group bacterium]